MTLINLNILLITGPIDGNTPIETIKEILDSHSISDYNEHRFEDEYYMSKLINIINSKNTKTIQEPYAKSDLRLIARFVNKDEIWKCGELIKAFIFLYKFFNRENLRINDSMINLNVGIQTMDHLHSLNASLLYAICKYNKIQTTKFTTIHQMYDNIKLFYYLENPIIKHDIRKYIYEKLVYGCMNKESLINILLISNDDYFIPNLSSLEFNNTSSPLEFNNTSPYINSILSNNNNIDYDELTNVSIEIKRSTVRRNPTTNLEAIIMTALYYKIDLTEVNNPIREYMELTKTPYFPIDMELTKRLREASKFPESLCNPRLDIIFNPELPIQLYDHDDLIKMCKYEGYEIDVISYDYDSPYSTLQLAYFLPTFVHGKQGNIINETTLYQEDLSDLDYDEVVVFGIRGEEFIAYTYSELSETFKYYKRFEDPQNKGNIFPIQCINKLYSLSKINQRRQETDEMFNERMGLIKNIEFVRTYQETDQETIKLFIDIYTTLKLQEQKKTEGLITLLLECGMYMRNWNGTGPYPIKSENTQVYPGEQDSVDLRVTESIIKLDQTVIDMNNDININNVMVNIKNHANDKGIGDLFFSLPLIMYDKYRNKLIPSSNDEEGLTIKDRLDIVKGGVDVSMESCMRLSSNRFCSTAYYYMKLIDMKLSFSIEDLSDIS